jgi:hypothetical protein
LRCFSAGLYRITERAVDAAVPLPRFKQIEGVYVSFDHPNFILVLTEIDRRLSMSGAVPLLVPR